MGWYGIFMLVGGIAVGGGWIVYWLYNRKLDREEALKPKVRSEHHVKTQSEVSDWAKKMAQFKGPPKRPTNNENTPNP